MKKQKIIKLIKKVKRRQRFDALDKKSLAVDKVFNTKQMANCFDKYLNWLIELVEKEDSNFSQS